MATSHPIVHIDIPATDTRAAADFYARLCGWEISVAEEFNYPMFRAEGGPGGGFISVDDNTKPGNIMIYIATDDIDGMLARAESLGAKTVVPKSEIPQTGWFAVFADPTGNQIGLYTDMQHVA